jgi:glutamate dehydrogenase/leucine dehydrogenase
MPPDRPSLFSASSLGLTIGWVSIPRSRANGIITGYTVQLTYPNATEVTFAVGLALIVNLTNLHPAQQYAIAISATTAAGSGLFGPALVVSTLDAGERVVACMREYTRTKS